MGKLTQRIKPIDINESWMTRFINITAGQQVITLNKSSNVFILRHHGLTGEIGISLTLNTIEQNAQSGQTISIARPFLFDEVVINSNVNLNNIVIIEAVVKNPVDFIVPVSNIVTIGAVNIKENQVIQPGLRPYIFNLRAVLANTEYSQILPINTRSFSFMLQENDAAYRIAYDTGLVASSIRPFLFFPAGGSFSLDGLRFTNTTIFFASTIADRWLQIIAIAD